MDRKVSIVDWTNMTKKYRRENLYSTVDFVQIHFNSFFKIRDLITDGKFYSFAGGKKL